VSNSSSNTQTSKSLLVENSCIALGQGHNPERENKIENAGIVIYNLYSSLTILSSHLYFSVYFKHLELLAAGLLDG
jgi:hypothetical protein